MEENIYLLISNEIRGPFGNEQVRAMYLAGTINSKTEYAKEGSSEWRSINELISTARNSEVRIESGPPENKPVSVVLDKESTTKLTPRANGTAVVQQPAIVSYNQSSDTFSGSMLSVVKLAVRSIQSLNWKVEYVNENIGSVSFEAGAGTITAYDYSCSISVEELGLNIYRVTSTGKLKPRGNTVFALDAGSGKNTAQKAVDRMKEMAMLPNQEFQSNSAPPRGCFYFVMATVVFVFIFVLIVISLANSNK